MHLNEMHEEIQQVIRKLAGEIIILGVNGYADDDIVERLRNLWFDLNCLNDTLGQSIKRMETETCPQKQHDAWSLNVPGADKNN